MIVDKNKRILVTGGAGFVGSYLVRQLLDRGYKNVFVLDNFSTGNRRAVPSGSIVVEGDLKNKKDLKSIPEGIDCVYHLAAATSVEESFEKPQFYAENNVIGTINLLEWMRDSKVGKIVYASSSAVYGDIPPSTLMTENLQACPVNYYGLTKLDGELMIYIWHKNFGMDYAIARYFNIFGGGQECSSPYASVIPKFVYSALKGDDLTVYGTGEQTRDFVYVEEACDATILLMEKGSGVYNVASGEEYNINTIADLILNNIKTKSRITHLPPIPGDAMRDNGCNKKIRELGWVRKNTFKEQLEMTIEWYREWAKNQDRRG